MSHLCHPPVRTVLTSLAGHHYELPVDHSDDITQVSIFLGVVCSIIMGVSHRAGDLIMGLLAVIL